MKTEVCKIFINSVWRLNEIKPKKSRKKPKKSRKKINARKIKKMWKKNDNMKWINEIKK